MLELVLVRHGETEWSRTGRHTGRTDVPLTEKGRRQAQAAGAQLAGLRFVRVLTSPASRAKETCRLAGFGDRAEPRDELLEWDYGAYEGRTTAEVRTERPGWTLWRDGVPGGETLAQVATRAGALLAELEPVTGPVLVVGHGHMLRVLAARWLDLDPGGGRLFALYPATISILGYEHEQRVIECWNETARASSAETGSSSVGACPG